jgi:hypothetical protein
LDSQRRSFREADSLPADVDTASELSRFQMIVKATVLDHLEHA